VTDGNVGRSEVPTDEELDRESKRIRVAGEWLDLALRQTLGVVAVGLMVAQLVVANVGFFIYGNANNWEIPTGALAAWLSATVVEVIGIVALVARYLFPEGGPRRNNG
jgi:hypothetical protein